MRRPVLHPFGAAVMAAGLWLGVCGVARAQHWPTGPVTLAGGRVLVAGDASATYGSEDPGWFTYTDYETSAIRRLRAGVTVEARATERIAFLAEVRAETGVGVTPYASVRQGEPFRPRVGGHPGRTDSPRVRDICSPQLSTGQPAHRVTADVSGP